MHAAAWKGSQPLPTRRQLHRVAEGSLDGVPAILERAGRRHQHVPARLREDEAVLLHPALGVVDLTAVDDAVVRIEHVLDLGVRATPPASHRARLESMEEDRVPTAVNGRIGPTARRHGGVATGEGGEPGQQDRLVAVESE
jgi:hypothetical protein